MTAPTPYHAGPGVTLYVGDAAAVLSALPAASVECVVTSPPFWGLRDYGTGRWEGGNRRCTHSGGRGGNRPQAIQPAVEYPATAGHRGGHPAHCRRCGAVRVDRQLGLEATPEDYVNALRAVFAQLHRLLVPTGTVWLNLGDCYSAGRPGRGREPVANSTPAGGTTTARARASVRAADIDRTCILPAKNLVGMPWRVAFALQADGWILRNAVVWYKPNGRPEPVADRLATRHEMLFLLVKQTRYFFDLDPIREPPAYPWNDNTAVGAGTGHHPDGTIRSGGGKDGGGTGKYADTSAFTGRPPGAALRPTGRRHTAAHPAGKNPGDVWSICTRPLKAAHFASFPVDLPLRCIAAGCPPGGVVLDPFSGAATTGLAALRLGRSFVGVDLNAAFHSIALERLGLTRHHPGVGGKAA